MKRHASLLALVLTLSFAAAALLAGIPADPETPPTLSGAGAVPEIVPTTTSDLAPTIPRLETPPTAFAIRETARLRAHFRTVLAELEARDVSELSPGQRRARARHIDALRAYAAAGVFPHNHHVPDRRVPVFVDEHGTMCAMGWLIARSGGEALVERVRATRNNATIHELADTPELVAWLDGAGLSLDEAARIQPMYGRPPASEPEPAGISARYALGSAIASGFGGASVALNLPSDRAGGASAWEGLLGVAAGAAGIALGADKIGDGGAATALGAVNAGIGIASLGLGARTLFTLPGDAAHPPTSAPASSRHLSLGAAPMVGVDGRAGVLLRARF